MALGDHQLLSILGLPDDGVTPSHGHIPVVQQIISDLLSHQTWPGPAASTGSMLALSEYQPKQPQRTMVVAAAAVVVPPVFRSETNASGAI